MFVQSGIHKIDHSKTNTCTPFISIIRKLGILLNHLSLYCLSKNCDYLSCSCNNWLLSKLFLAIIL